MKLKWIQTFSTVCQTGSYVQAAQRLECDPSQVSRFIAQLEEHLRTKLFHRSTRKISLTEEGKAYQQAIEPILEQLQAVELRFQINQEPQGLLRVTASSSFGQVWLTPLLPEFLAQYPKVELELLLSDQISDLEAERIQVAIRLGSGAPGKPHYGCV